MCFNIIVTKKEADVYKYFLYLKNYYFLSKERGTPQSVFLIVSQNPQSTVYFSSSLKHNCVFLSIL